MPVKFLTQSNFDRGQSKLRLHSQPKSEPLNLNAVSKQLRAGHLQKNDCESSSKCNRATWRHSFFHKARFFGCCRGRHRLPVRPGRRILFDKLSNRFKL
jgi:hypothetical protein